MKDRKVFRRVLLVAMVAVLFMGVGLARAQGPDMDEQPADVTAVAGTVGSAFTYQGRITYNGLPYDSKYDLRFRLFDAAAGGHQVDSTRYFINYQVSRGLFTVPLDFGSAFQGSSRWLEIGIRPWNSSGPYTVVSRQTVRVVPYALSLRPGAGIVGTVPSRSALHIENDDSHTNAAGVYAKASNSSTSAPTYGVRGISNSSGGVGVQGYSSKGKGVVGESSTGVGVIAKSAAGSLFEGWDTTPNAQRFYVSNGGNLYTAGSIKSGRTTRWTVSPMKMTAYSSDLQILPVGTGHVILSRSGGSSIQYAYLPVDVPGVLFGTAIKLSQVHFCYKADSTSDYITEFNARYVKDDGSFTTLVGSTANYTSTSWHCQTLTDATPNQISGSLFLRFVLYFSGTGSGHKFYIGNVYLTLSE